LHEKFYNLLHQTSLEYQAGQENWVDMQHAWERKKLIKKAVDRKVK
jgi:hypothetical protein